MIQDRSNQESIHDIQGVEQLSDQDLQNITAAVCTACPVVAQYSRDRAVNIADGVAKAPEGVRDAYQNLATKASNDAMRAHEQGIQIGSYCPKCEENKNEFVRLGNQLTYPKK